MSCAPIPVTRGGEAGDEISISSTLAVALLFIAPVGVALAAQALALVIDESVKRRLWLRMAFNVGQYTLALFGTRLVFSLLTGQSLGGAPPAFIGGALPAALAAAVVFFLINYGLTGIAVAINFGNPCSGISGETSAGSS